MIVPWVTHRGESLGGLVNRQFTQQKERQATHKT